MISRHRLINLTPAPAFDLPYRSHSPSGGRLLGNLLALGVLAWLVLYGVQSLTGWWGVPPFLGCWLGQLCLWLVNSQVCLAVASIAFLVWALSLFRAVAALVAMIVALVVWSLLQTEALQLLASCT